MRTCAAPLLVHGKPASVLPLLSFLLDAQEREELNDAPESRHIRGPCEDQNAFATAQKDGQAFQIIDDVRLVDTELVEPNIRRTAVNLAELLTPFC